MEVKTMRILGNFFDFNGDGHMSIAEQTAEYLYFKDMVDGSNLSDDDEFSFEDFDE